MPGHPSKMPSLRTLPVFGILANSLLSVLASPTSQPQTPISSLKHKAGEEDDTPLPVVIWHGLGDNYAAEGLQGVGEVIQKVNPGTFVYYIRLDDSASSDRTATFYGNVTEQIAKVCADLASHPILSTAPAIDAVGFSQGGQFLRGYIERCNAPPVRSLVTFGSQHNGIVDYRTCASSDWLCKGAMALLHGNTWSGWVQGRLVPAQYFRDPADLGDYLARSNFLADINNEREAKNATYARNLARLDNFVMYVFGDDTTVVPKETGWFEDVADGKRTPLRERPLYTEDWIGLRELDRKGALQFKTIAGAEHMDIPDGVIAESVAELFGPAGRAFPRRHEDVFDEL
ncbi:palmitoyl-protein thioesterase precursor [Camillea tinctor]|nr:palmitoyl-protein thioesterase precursor [Camillea tinctor]